MRAKGEALRIGAKLARFADEAPLEPMPSARKGIQSVDILFSILRVLESSGTALQLSEVARRTEQQPSKVHHYLVSLMRNGVVRQNSNGSYDLGSYALQLGLAALGRMDIVERASEAIATFRDQTGEACFLSVWGSRGPTIIRYFEGTRPVTVEARAGLVLPLLTSATGQVYLGWLPETAWGYIANFELRSLSGLDVDRLRQKVLRAGVGITRGELLPRIAAVSAPVLDHRGDLVCALTTLGLLGEIDVEATGKTVQLLHGCAQDLSKELGLHEGYPKLVQMSEFDAT